MKVSVCIASRGRPALLHHALDVLCAGMWLPETRIAVALDDDDAPQYWGLKDPAPEWIMWAPHDHMDRVKYSIESREDSLGAKYNRAQHTVPADLYVLWADDMTMPDKGWDAKLAEAAAILSDQCGIVLFGEIPGVLQPGLAMTQKFIDAQGFFNVPYFPFWWGETWPLEIATMADCRVHADVRVELLQSIKGASRGIREIPFWAELFDRLRPSRVEVARKIIAMRPANEQRPLLDKLHAWEAHWLYSNSVLRDPVRAAELEKHYSFDAPADERYLRLKAKAETMLAELR